MYFFMDNIKEDFISFLFEHNAIEFGNNLIKNGRVSPYMINTRNVSTAAGIIELSRYYAEAIREHIGVQSVDVIFGPAYNGIPLCVSTAEHLVVENEDIGFLYNRKEEKIYAEGSDSIRRKVVGSIPKPGQSVVIVDDVLTSSHTKRECIDILFQVEPKASISGLVVAVDRQETDRDGADALATFTHYTRVPVYPIVTISDILDYLAIEEMDEEIDKIQSYLNTYGIRKVRK